jgi:hypothetical protein
MKKRSSFEVFVALTAFLLIPAVLPARTFRDDQGRQIKAELISFQDGQVTIKKGGRDFTLPISKFSSEDQAYIKEWAAKSDPEEPETSPPPENAPKPGETLKFDFPDLVEDFKGQPASFAAKIPASYDPAKPVGLIIFLGGGTGGNSPGGASGLVKNDFVCAGLPYPDNGRNPKQDNMVGKFRNVWEYWKPMLARLEEAVPNLDPKLRIIGGFSNGGHAIDGLMRETEFVDSFTAFVLIDGGGALGGSYRNARDKHAYVAWGEKSPNKSNSEAVAKRAERARMRVVSHEMEGVGHAFPASEKELVTKWIYETVIPDAKGSNQTGE